MIFKLVEPTYQAYSLLLIESNQPELFGPTLLARDGGGATPSYLQSQLTSITTDRVLDQAISGTVISNLPMIKDSTDPKTDLRKKLDLQIIPNTHWIRVALESTDPKEAAQIVNAVVDAFNENTKSFGTGATKLLKTDLENVQGETERRHREGEKDATESRHKGKRGGTCRRRKIHAPEDGR